MKILKIDKKENKLILVPQVLDDLWHLEKILEKGDIVSAKTERKIKAKTVGQQAEKISMYLDIELKEINYSKFNGLMRLAGIIVGGKPEELIELKSHHSIQVNLGEKIVIQKKELRQYQIDRLKKAESSMKKPKMLVIVLDDEQADIANLSDFGLEPKVTIFSGKQGKRFKSEPSQKFFEEILEKIKGTELNKIIIAGPGFTKDEFKDFLEKKASHLKLNFLFESINSVGETGLNELLKSGITDKAIQEMEIVKETKLIEKVFQELGKNSGLIEYGLNEVEKAVEFGAVQELLVTDKFLSQNRVEVEKIMNAVESMKGQIHIISHEHEAGKQLHNLSGIAAFLRYKIK